MGKQYTVEYERDEDGMWVAVIDRAQGVSCVAQGRSLGEARRRVREALGVFLDDSNAAEAADLIDHVKLPGPIKVAIAAVLREREKARRAQEQSLQKASIASEMLERQGLSRRDAAELLGLSHQRIQQYAQQASLRREERAAAQAGRSSARVKQAIRTAASKPATKKSATKRTRAEAREAAH